MRERIFRVLDYMIPVAIGGRVRAPRSQHLPPRHQAREHPHRPARPEPARLDARGAPRRLQRRQARTTRRSNFGMTRMKQRPRHALFPEPRAGDERHRAPRERAAGLARGRVLRGLLHPDRQERHVLALQPRRAVPDPLRRPRARSASSSAARTATRARPTSARKVQKSVGRPADIYSLGALLLLFDQRRLREPEDALRRVPQVHRVRARRREQHDRGVPRARVLGHPARCARRKRRRTAARRRRAGRSLLQRTSTTSTATASSSIPHVMKIIAKCMIRNKPDSYCQAHDVDTRGISELVQRPHRSLLDLRRPPRRAPGATSPRRGPRRRRRSTRPFHQSRLRLALARRSPSALSQATAMLDRRAA